MESNDKNTLTIKKTSKIKKILKSKLFWIAVVIIVVLGVWIASTLSNTGSQVEYVTSKTIRGNLIQTVSATGEVESAQDIDLNFKFSGRLVYLPVDEGDVVKAGSVLARLDSSGLSAQVQQYQANLTSAQADLERIQAGSSQEDIKVTEEKVAKAENDLESLEIKRDDELQTLREKTLNALNNAAFTASVALDKVYNYLINTDLTTNLQVRNSDLQNNINTDYLLITESLIIADSSLEIANNTKTNTTIITASENMIQVLSDLNSFLNDSFSVADSIILNSSYSQTTKDAIKSDISTQQSTNNTSLTSIQTAKSNLVNSVNSYSSQIQAAENNLSIYRAELNLKKAGPRDFEIKSYEAKVAQARAQLNKALADLGDYAIVAPIDGTITKVNFNVGEQTSMSQPAIKMLSTEEFEVKVDISESDITKIEVGDKTVIELDAFGSDHIFSGTIIFIDPAQTVIQDVTYYNTTVSFDSDEWTKQIKSGMTADVTITTAEKEDILYIPQRSVKIREAILGEVGEKYVEVLASDNQLIEKAVVIGLRGDDGLVEVLSGIEEGDMVVTFKKNGK